MQNETYQVAVTIPAPDQPELVWAGTGPKLLRIHEINLLIDWLKKHQSTVVNVTGNLHVTLNTEVKTDGEP